MTLHLINYNKKERLKNKLRIRQLEIRLARRGGRSQGKITSPRRVNKNKILYRFPNYDKMKENILCVIAVNFKMNAITNVSLNLYVDLYGNLFYMPSIDKLKSSTVLYVGFKNPKNIGDIDQIRYHNTGSILHNLSLHPGLTPTFIRAAGTSSILIKRRKEYSLMKLRSGEYRYLLSKNYATLGVLANKDHYLKHAKNAGAVQHKRRPRNRPSARNPVDHPLGGRTKGGYPAVDAKGHLSINRPTRSRKNRWVVYTKRQMKFRRF